MHIAPNQDEYNARNDADIDWLDRSFAEAKANGEAAVMIIGQADPGFERAREPLIGERIAQELLALPERRDQTLSRRAVTS